MKIWKPLVKFAKQRKEWAWYTDFALERREELWLEIAGERHFLEMCPPDTELRIHIEICVKPFNKEDR